MSAPAGGHGTSGQQVTFTIPRPLWLTSNRPIRIHAQKAKIVRELHALAQACARSQGLAPVDEQRHAVWFVAYPKGTTWAKGDAANAHPTCKALLDALVPEWMPDDGPRNVVAETYTRAPNLDEPRLHTVTLRLVAHRPEVLA